jgi:hypothetical protein
VQPPFTISAEAERYLRKRFEHAPPEGMETALHGSSRMEVRNKQGKLTARCERQRYFIGYSPPDKHIEFVHFDIFGRSVAFHPKVLESLTGRCLSLDQSDCLEGVDRTIEILIAVPFDEACKQT